MSEEAWALKDVGELLDRARDEGEALGVPVLREQAGIGHETLQKVLSELRERGEAVESAPGEWRRPFDDELAAQREPTAAGGEGEHGADEREPRDRLPVFPPRRGTVLSADEGNVVLTGKVLAALDAETIGKIVMAGVEDAGTAVFTLTVRP